MNDELSRSVGIWRQLGVVVGILIGFILMFITENFILFVIVASCSAGVLGVLGEKYAKNRYNKQHPSEQAQSKAEEH